MQKKAYACMQRYERVTADEGRTDIVLATPQQAPITVLVADDDPVVRDGLTTILNSQRDIMVVADAANGEEAYSLCQLLLPNVVILDLRLAKKDGVQFLRELRPRKTAKPKVVIMSSCNTQEDMRRALRAGAKAFLTKVADPQQICESVRRVANGETYFPVAAGDSGVNSPANSKT